MSLRLTAVRAVVAVTVLACASGSWATDYTWGGGSNGPQTTGDFSWSTAGNWTSDHVPFYPDGVIIGDAVGVRNIHTPTGSPWVWGNTVMSQSATADPALVNKLTLENDVSMVSPFQTNFTNDSSNAPGQLVFDLNGHTFNGYLNTTWSNMTIRNSSPATGALSTIYGIGLDSAVIENGVKVVDRGAFYGGGVWQPGSKLVIADASVQYNYVAGALQNVDIGINGNPTQGSLYIQFYNQINGDLNIYAPTNTNPLQFSASYLTLSVAGNFIDNGTSSGANTWRSFTRCGRRSS